MYMDPIQENNIFPDTSIEVGRQAKERLLNQKGKVFWFTGLSGSGKSTIASELEKLCHSKGFFTIILDGDNIRSGLNKGLGFSYEDRMENIRRIAEVAKLFKDQGVITICSFVSPTIAARNLARQIIGAHDFKEVYVETPLEVCEARDVKGLYKKARTGVIKNFTGIGAPFEEPLHADYVLNTTTDDAGALAEKLLGDILNDR